MYMAKKSAYSMNVKCLCGKKEGVMKFLHYLYSEKFFMCKKKLFLFFGKSFCDFLKSFLGECI